MDVWNSNMQRVFGDIREKQIGNLENNIEKYISQAYGRLQGIARVLHDRMSKNPPPVRVLSEITITNPSTRHEGRVDAIFQYPEYSETVESSSDNLSANPFHDSISLVRISS
jgi:hypothetical protein